MDDGAERRIQAYPGKEISGDPREAEFAGSFTAEVTADQNDCSR
ncbi:MAG: hypothetical protein NTY16_05425 [Deltaproteobacteria bacterium]|nr:hypothetical protein [Deltaproteobacteria bacterium]